MYENNKLDVFTRNRVNNVRSKVPLKSLHWVEGKENLSDTGTRPDLITDKSVSPDSEWIMGKAWMRSSYDEALQAGVIRQVSDIQLGHESKKKIKEGLLVEEEFEKQIHGFLVRTSLNDAQKIVECEAASKYIYPPLKYRFRRTIRTISCVLLAIKKFKLLLLRAKAKRGMEVDSQLEKIRNPPVKFRYFTAVQKTVNKDLKCFFNVDGFVTNPDNEKDLVTIRRKYFALSETDLSAGLEYLYKVGTKEVLRHVEKKKVDEVAVLNDGVLYFKGRVLDEQSLRIMGDLEDIVVLV